jgi:glycosyltransferase involved in cell wall biosynthesis
LGIDADSWKPLDRADTADARESEVVIVHPTNHRSIKGTDFLVKAVKELVDEGLHVRLEIMQGRSNEEVKSAMAAADMVAEQFIAGYGLTGVEAMALGRPVLSNLTWLGQEFLTDTFIRECPIVNTTPQTLKDDVRRLAVDPELRGRLGRAGRDYVLKYHSAEAVGRIWKSILRHVWLQEPVASKVSAAFASRAETG